MAKAESKITQAPHAEQTDHTANDSGNVFSEFFSATYDGAIGGSIKSIKQLGGINTGDSAAAQKPLHGAMKVAEVLGNAAGQFIDFAVLSKVCGGVLERTGAAKALGEGALNRAVSSATVGFVHGAILTPVDQTRQEGFIQRLANGSVEGVAFATVGGTGSRLERRFGQSFVGRTKASFLSGAAGGAVEGVLAPLTHGQAPTLDGVASNVGSWAFGNALIGLHKSAKPALAPSTTWVEETASPGKQMRSLLDLNNVQYYRDGDRVSFGPFTKRSTQFKADETRGIYIDHRWEGHLLKMPSHIEGVGDLDYGHTSTTMTNREGSFERDIHTGTVKFKAPTGETYTLYDNNNYEVRRGLYDIYFTDGRATSASEPGQLRWTFGEDGSMSMRSVPSGKNQVYLNAEGEGTFRSYYGTSRAISGAVRGMNHKPLEGTTEPVSLDRENRTVAGFQVPDTTPMSPITRAHLNQARDILKQLAPPEKALALRYN